MVARFFRGNDISRASDHVTPGIIARAARRALPHEDTSGKTRHTRKQQPHSGSRSRQPTASVVGKRATKTKAHLTHQPRDNTKRARNTQKQHTHSGSRSRQPTASVVGNAPQNPDSTLTITARNQQKHTHSGSRSRQPTASAVGKLNPASRPPPPQSLPSLLSL
jgi:hypothetical protein